MKDKITGLHIMTPQQKAFKRIRTSIEMVEIMIGEIKEAMEVAEADMEECSIDWKKEKKDELRQEAIDDEIAESKIDELGIFE